MVVNYWALPRAREVGGEGKGVFAMACYRCILPAAGSRAFRFSWPDFLRWLPAFHFLCTVWPWLSERLPAFRFQGPGFLSGFRLSTFCGLGFLSGLTSKVDTGPPHACCAMQPSFAHQPQAQGVETDVHFV